MGFRTTVILYNDRASEWENDALLGKKIAQCMHFTSMTQGFGNSPDLRASFGSGSVVECVHADTQTLAVLDSYNFHPVAYSNWQREQTTDATALKLLKQAADQLGYRLIKKASE